MPTTSHTQDGGLASFWRVGTGGNGIKCQLRPNKWREGCRKVPTTYVQTSKMVWRGFGESGLAKGERKVPTTSEQAKQFGKVFLASGDWREWDKVPTTSKQKG